MLAPTSLSPEVAKSLSKCLDVSQVVGAVVGAPRVSGALDLSLRDGCPGVGSARNSTRFDTEGSEVQILSPRPIFPENIGDS